MVPAFANYRKDNWDERLVDFEVAYNSTVNSMTLFSPVYINYGMNPRIIPLGVLISHYPSAKSFIETVRDATKFAYDRSMIQNQKMTTNANKSRMKHNFKLEGLVWLSANNLSVGYRSRVRKIHTSFCGLFKPTRKTKDVIFKLEISDTIKEHGIHNKFHHSFLKPRVADKFGCYNKPLLLGQLGDQIEYEVESIFD